MLPKRPQSPQPTRGTISAPNLSVRVSGWSARFATLDKQWQDMIIARTQQRAG